MIGGGDLR